MSLKLRIFLLKIFVFLETVKFYADIVNWFKIVKLLFFVSDLYAYKLLLLKGSVRVNRG